MANIPNMPSLVDGLRFDFQEGAPRGAPNKGYYFPFPSTPTSTRPEAGQAWPRGNVRGNG
jgi:hypothetical protein